MVSGFKLKSNKENIFPSHRYSDVLNPPKYSELSLSKQDIVDNVLIGAYHKQHKTKIKDINGIQFMIFDDGLQYHITCTNYKLSHEIVFINNKNAKNPTWNKLKQFLTRNITYQKARENSIYKRDEFMCADFAVALHNNAEANGIRCACVCIEVRNGVDHMLTLFDTTDHGWVFVDPTFKMALSKKNFIAQGKPYKPDFASTFTSDITKYTPSKFKYYFDDGLEFVEITW